jgi:hypothetical protein
MNMKKKASDDTSRYGETFGRKVDAKGAFLTTYFDHMMYITVPQKRGEIDETESSSVVNQRRKKQG